MAFSVVWDSTFRGTPAGSDDIREGDDRIRELKDALQERLEREHYLDSASNANQGLHLKGSAVSYYAGGSDPTTRPDGVTALGDNDYDKGRLYLETTAIASANSLKAWDGTAWEYAGLAQTTQDVYGNKDFKGSVLTFASGAIFSGGPLTISSSVDISGDLNVGGTLALGDASVSQAKLKTSLGSVSRAASSTYTLDSNLLLPGGQYGFWPQFKTSNAGYKPIVAINLGMYRMNEADYNIVYASALYGSTSYSSRINVGNTSSSGITYVQQRYVTSSGEIYWVFQIMRKSDGKLLAQWQAPDHPSFGEGSPDEILDIPFGNYDPKTGLYHGEEVDIIVINPLKDQITEIKNQAKKDRKDPLEIISEVYEMSDIKTPLWPGKNGKPDYYPEPVTVGLADDEFPFGGTAEVAKRVIPKPSYVQVKKLVPRNLTQV